MGNGSRSFKLERLLGDLCLCRGARLEIPAGNSRVSPAVEQPRTAPLRHHFPKLHLDRTRRCETGFYSGEEPARRCPRPVLSHAACPAARARKTLPPFRPVARQRQPPLVWFESLQRADRRLEVNLTLSVHEKFKLR